MKIFIAGANGKIGRHLIQMLKDSPHQTRAMVRQTEQVPELANLGADEVVLGNLEQDCTGHLPGCDAIVFTAGSGPHTGPDKTIDVDQNGAKNLMDSAHSVGIQHFVMVSSMRAHAPEKAPEKLHHYLAAKQNADLHLQTIGIPYTIVCPGPLTDDPGTGRVQIGQPLNAEGSIPREDVARVIVAAIDAPNMANQRFDVLSGDTLIEEALQRWVR